MTVRDSIEKITFVDDIYNGKDVSTVSPDGRFFFVITKRGVLRSNQVESTVWLFDSGAVSSIFRNSAKTHNLSPRALATLGTVSNDDPITEARWATDSQSIAFLGRKEGSERHLFSVSVADGRLKQLSPDGKDVTGFDRSNDAFVFTTGMSVSDSQLYESGGPTLPDVEIGTGTSLFNLLYPAAQKRDSERCELWQFRNGEASLVRDAKTSVPLSLIGRLISLSPAGRYAVVTNVAEYVPQSWESYDSYSPMLKIVADKERTKSMLDSFRPHRYELVDFRSGGMSVLIDAPLGQGTGIFDAQAALWSQNEREVILTNTFLPLEGESATNLFRSLRPWVVAVDIGSRRIIRIKETPPRDSSGNTHPRLSGIEWQVTGEQLLLRYYDYYPAPPPQAEMFQKENGTWKFGGNADSAKRPSAVDGVVQVRQGLNEPPVLVLRNRQTGTSRTIWDPNPQFAKLKLGEATVYKWHDKMGREWTGGLVRPPDYVAGRRYPLVIQTHGFDPNEFITDGFAPTANAARPMAARGILVLQVGEGSLSPGTRSTPLEAVERRGGYLAAIDQLDADGLIDPRKVGIIGFSRTGWYVLDLLIHDGKHFAAATLAEATYNSLSEYELNADYLIPERAKMIASSVGSEPFDLGLQKWFSDSPGFNTDKIHVPILFEAHNPWALIYAWDIYALMRLQHKPVELLYLRNGEHVLSKPRERLASQEMNLDWYDFWLNGHVDPVPTKAERYARWRELRRLEQRHGMERSELDVPVSH